MTFIFLRLKLKGMENIRSGDDKDFKDKIREILRRTSEADTRGKDKVYQYGLSKDLQRELAAVKKMLDDIVVSIQSANEKITRISEVIATNRDINNNNSNKVKNNSSDSKKWQKQRQKQ